MTIQYSEIARKEIVWKNTSSANELCAFINGKLWKLTMNPNFPFEDMYTIKIADETLNFNVWPTDWFISE